MKPLVSLSFLFSVKPLRELQPCARNKRVRKLTGADQGLLQTLGEGMPSTMLDVLQNYGWSSICFFFKGKPLFYLTFLSILKWSVATEWYFVWTGLDWCKIEMALDSSRKWAASEPTAPLPGALTRRPSACVSPVGSGPPYMSSFKGLTKYLQYK